MTKNITQIKDDFEITVEDDNLIFAVDNTTPVTGGVLWATIKGWLDERFTKIFGVPAANDFAKFTAIRTLTGRSYSEVRNDLNVADGAEVNPSVVSQAEAEGGTSTAERIWTSQRVAQAIAALGGSGLTDTEISPTTADVTLTINTRHYVSASGLTADRALKFPSGSAEDVIEIVIINEHASYACKLQGDTGVDVEGLTATEWDRLYHTGMALKFEYRASDGWRLLSDNRNGLWRKITLASPSSSITFDNIPDIYNVIEFEMSLRSDKITVTGQAMRFRVNNLSSSIYTYTLYFWVSDGTTGELEGLQQAQSIFTSIPSGGAPANHFAGGTLTFGDYASSVHKFAQFRGGRIGSYTVTGDVRLYDSMSAIEETSAINEVEIFDATDNLIAGSVITMYARNK